MRQDPDVSAWFERLEHPLKDAMLAVRAAILAADERMGESLKWQSPTFEYRGNLASIDPRAKKHVSVLFHTGATIPDDHPLLEGGGKVARYIRFGDRAAVEAAAPQLAAIVRAWCDARG